MLLIAKKLGILSAIFLFFAFPVFLSPVFAADQAPTAESTGNYGLDTSAKGTGLLDKTNTPQSIVGTVVGAVLSLLGVVFFLLIFYGGLRWMLAQGNEAEVEKAKEILIAAVIGLIIVLAAYAITTFIGNQLTSSK
jgi:cbb3-type cytochrome oxidase subunit 3